MEELPIEIIQKIAFYLPTEDIKRFILSGLLEVDDSFWSTLTKRNYGKVEKNNTSWLKLYLNLEKINSMYFYLTVEYPLGNEKEDYERLLYNNKIIFPCDSPFSIVPGPCVYRKISSTRGKFFFLLEKTEKRIVFKQLEDYVRKWSKERMFFSVEKKEQLKGELNINDWTKLKEYLLGTEIRFFASLRKISVEKN